MNTKKHYDKNDFIMTLLKGRTFIVLIILVILFSILSENFFSTSTLLMVAKHVALYGILAIGMTYGSTAQLLRQALSNHPSGRKP